MRYLGIDFGSKRVGVATSDEEGRLAFPHSVVTNGESLIKEIKKIIEEEKVGKIVVGESKNFVGEPNEIMKKAEEFIDGLEREVDGIEIILEPEFLTSAQADSIRHVQANRGVVSRPGHKDDKSNMLDASAAAIILQSYLDRSR